MIPLFEVSIGPAASDQAKQLEHFNFKDNNQIKKLNNF
jgi:hypothetical protein